MSFSKQHFELTAQILNNMDEQPSKSQLIEAFCVAFEIKSSRFNKERFIEKCRGEESE